MENHALQDLISLLNEKHFLGEFAFGKPEFIDTDGGKKEFADCVIWLEDEVVLFQVKERDEDSIKNYKSESNWFKNKILKLAKKQIKDTIDYLQRNEVIEIVNIKGHKFRLTTTDRMMIHKAIIHRHTKLVAPELKFYISRDVGFIHIIDFYDYELICKVLDTPIEIVEFLSFRERLLTNYKLGVTSDKSILGAFLKHQTIEYLNKSYPNTKDYQVVLFDLEQVVDNLKMEQSEYDIDYILRSYGDKQYLPLKDDTDYYKILVELVKMNRKERKQFKIRWEKCVFDIKKQKEELPYRMSIKRTKCGVVFLPLPKKCHSYRFSVLQRYTVLSKYDLKLDKHIGISFCECEGDHDFNVDYCYAESKWEQNFHLERKLVDRFPFRPFNYIVNDLYKFENKG